LEDAKQVRWLWRLKHLSLGGAAQRDRALEVACVVVGDGRVDLPLGRYPLAGLDDTIGHDWSPFREGVYRIAAAGAMAALPVVKPSSRPSRQKGSKTNARRTSR
jgi:hypothetical protein